MGQAYARLAEPREPKGGAPWSELRDGVATLDLVFFRGAEPVSAAIAAAQAAAAGAAAAAYTHVGVAVRADDVAGAAGLGLAAGGLYVFEATGGGWLGDGVRDARGRTRLGAQLRDLDRVVAAYDAAPRARLAWARLRAERRPPADPAALAAVIRRYEGAGYDTPLALLGAAFRRARCARACEAAACPCARRRLFCSELAAAVYRDLGVFPPELDPRDVTPADLLAGAGGAAPDPDAAVPAAFDPPVPFAGGR